MSLLPSPYERWAPLVDRIMLWTAVVGLSFVAGVLAQRHFGV